MIVKTLDYKNIELAGVVDYTPELLDELKSDAEAATLAMRGSLLEVDKVLSVKWVDTIYNSSLKHNSHIELSEHQMLMIIEIDFVDDEGDEFTRLIGAIAMDYEQGWGLFNRGELDTAIGIHYSEEQLEHAIEKAGGVDLDATWDNPRNGVEPVNIMRQVEAYDLTDEQERLALSGDL